MNIHLICFYSELNKLSSVLKSHETLLNGIREHFTLHIADYKDTADLPDEALKIVFIATGGVERLVSQQFESLPYPPVLLADGLQNSLAATLEIATWLRYKGMKSHIIHGETPDIIRQLKMTARNFSAMRKLHGRRIGVIGGASPWLIASDVDFLLAKQRWGLDFIETRIEEVCELYDRIAVGDTGRAAARFVSRASALCEASHDDILKAMRLYQALGQLCEKERFSALTLNCFTLIEKLKTTGCVALSLLNDDGIPAGCEGDLQALFTLLTVNAVTGKYGFMANPSKLDTGRNEVLLSHCTVATTLTEQYKVRNHFESDSGVGIQGILPAGRVTIVKCGGECLDEFFVSAGTLTGNTDYPDMCRTQVKVVLDNPVSYFLRNPLGNHHILIPGDHAEELELFYTGNNCMRME